MNKLLCEKDKLEDSEDFGISTLIKEQYCYVSQDFEEALKGNTKEGDKKYELGDGRTISIEEESFKVPEVLFQPTLLELD